MDILKQVDEIAHQHLTKTGTVIDVYVCRSDKTPAMGDFCNCPGCHSSQSMVCVAVLEELTGRRAVLFICTNCGGHGVVINQDGKR